MPHVDVNVVRALSMPDLSPRTTQDADGLVRSIATQDHAAFAELYASFGPRIKGFLVQKLRDPVLAEEVLQDVMLTIWRRASVFDPTKASATTWIFTIARNRMVDRIRRSGRPDPSADDPNWVPAAPVAADEAVDHAQRAARIQSALAALPEAQRQVLHLTFFESRSYSEIATSLDVALGTVKSRARLGFQRLRGLLEDA